MLGHVTKKQRVDRVQDSSSDGYLHGIKVSAQRPSPTRSDPPCCHTSATATWKACTWRQAALSASGSDPTMRSQVFLQKSTISNAVARSNIWSRKIISAGGVVTQVWILPGGSGANPLCKNQSARVSCTRCASTRRARPIVQDAESATHVIIGEKHEALPALSLPKRVHVVGSVWLENCLSKQRRLPERDYAADLEELAKEAGSMLPPLPLGSTFLVSRITSYSNLDTLDSYQYCLQSEFLQCKQPWPLKTRAPVHKVPVGGVYPNYTSAVPAQYAYQVGIQHADWGSGQGSLEERSSPLRKYEKWLGHWKPEYNAFTKETEVVLQVSLRSRPLAALPVIEDGNGQPSHLAASITDFHLMAATLSDQVIIVAGDLAPMS